MYLTHRKQVQGQTVAREFVIDIDINDYPKRECCENAPTVCTRCWAYLVLAIRVVDRALREDWGYKRLLWVYSGRRGVHLWVCDSDAVLLTDKGRQEVVKSLGGFRNLKGKEVSTWRPETSTAEVEGKWMVDRMRRPIEPSFR
jgi:DNA primase small subunit